MPLPPHKTITTLDFPAVEQQIRQLALVVKAASEFPDPDSQRFAALVTGAVQALTWVTGGPAGSELYSAMLDGEQLTADTIRNAAAHR
jgi:hypothetical protein